MVNQSTGVGAKEDASRGSITDDELAGKTVKCRKYLRKVGGFPGFPRRPFTHGERGQARDGQIWPESSASHSVATILALLTKCKQQALREPTTRYWHFACHEGALPGLLLDGEEYQVCSPGGIANTDLELSEIVRAAAEEQSLTFPSGSGGDGALPGTAGESPESLPSKSHLGVSVASFRVSAHHVGQHYPPSAPTPHPAVDNGGILMETAPQLYHLHTFVKGSSGWNSANAFDSAAFGIPKPIIIAFLS
ncbi:hypothetical protein Efla_001605 [Eimeria flavescens]